MFKLVIQDDEGKTTVVPLIRDEITIGRKEGNTIRLTERNVSRRHARIVRSNGEVQIEDLGSYNGIRVNNARIAERVSLRISDQVQIGDYKLYLKAEGVEQVDDARTMPIERQGLGDNGTPVGDGAVAAASLTPTAPIAATPPPAQRASLAVADTDPAGRPVATAAQVAALSSSVGYGKLVVMSSNFAGKEFELTRPQMIVGRTDENDLVVNHRSISRNHAKITRDPETQRYTISDLQSSNGVRVNGQDYGKVELRRGDIVDLGHVRLRFVEPGEEFVFTPAMIADIPDAGSRKGLMIAVILAIVVLGAVGAFFVFKNGGGDKNSQTNPVGSDGSAVAIGSNPTPEHGSNQVVIAEPDASEGTTNPSNNDSEIKRITSECMNDVADRKWDNVAMCADNLAKLDPKLGEKFKKQAHAETQNEANKAKLEAELSNNNLKSARKILDAIPDESVYHADAAQKIEAAENKIVEEFKARAAKAKRDGKCKDIDVMITQATQASSRAGDAVRAFKCEAAVIAPPPPTDCTSVLRDANDKKCLRQFCADHKDDSHCPQQAANNPPPASCNADELREAGTNSEAMGAHAQAVKQFEQALACKSDPHTVQLTFMASCNARNQAKAKVYWKRMSPDAQNRVVSMCIRNGIDRTVLDAP